MNNLPQIATHALRNVNIIAAVFGKTWSESELWSQVDKAICQELNCESNEQTREASIRVVSPSIYGPIEDMTI